MATCYDCIHCDVCSGIGACSYHCSDVSKCKHFKNKADFVEMKHGEWIKNDAIFSFIYYTCSLCVNLADNDGDGNYIVSTPFCSCCGAKMDGEKPVNYGSSKTNHT